MGEDHGKSFQISAAILCWPKPLHKNDDNIHTIKKLFFTIENLGYEKHMKNIWKTYEIPDHYFAFLSQETKLFLLSLINISTRLLYCINRSNLSLIYILESFINSCFCHKSKHMFPLWLAINEMVLNCKWDMISGTVACSQNPFRTVLLLKRKKKNNSTDSLDNFRQTIFDRQPGCDIWICNLSSRGDSCLVTQILVDSVAPQVWHHLT